MLAKAGPAPVERANSSPGSGIGPEVLAHIEEALTRHMGPIAQVLVRRANHAGVTLDELRARLAEQIPDEAERAIFLRSVGVEDR